MLARDRCRDQSSIRRALHFLNSIHGRQSSDGRTKFLRTPDNLFDDFRRDERTHGIVHEHDIVILRRNCCQCVSDGLLPVLTAFHQFDSLLVRPFALKALAEPGDLVLTQRHQDFGHARTRGKLPQGMNENRGSAQFRKLFGGNLGLRAGRRGHARSQSRSRNDDGDLHGGRQV